MSTWFKKPRPKEAHTCKVPQNEADVMVGDRWQCDCGQVWEITKFTSLFDSKRRISWKKVYAPGVGGEPFETDGPLPGESLQSHMEIR